MLSSVLSKQKRLQLFFERLVAAPPAGSADDGFDLLAKALNSVEDEFSGVPYRPENWRTDGRMYPPQEDSRVRSPDRPLLRKYRNKGHYNYIGTNGSIRIETLEAEILLDKPGTDGRRTHDLDS